MSNGYVHTRKELEMWTERLIHGSQEPEMIRLIGEVGLVLAERLEAIVNVLEGMEKTL